MNNKVLLNEIDWCHLSNIVYAYDTHCLKTYVEQRGKMLFYGTSEHERTIEDYSVFPISVTLSISAFARSLPAFQSLSRSVQNFLCENNLRRLIFMNLHELNQSCFSESWQVNNDQIEFIHIKIIFYSIDCYLSNRLGITLWSRTIQTISIH
jgi:hypothetical protein